ncbi:MAG: SCO family protein [Bacteroidota bacterium]|jgi:protein SCO1/2
MRRYLNLFNAFLFFILFNFSCSSGERKTETPQNLLPIIGEKKLSSNGKDTVYHTIPEFSFTNQFGEIVNEKITKDKIYVADFFFATCTSICPVMSKQMGLVQNAFREDKDVLILSHTVNPMHDTVEVLNAYGNKFGAIKDKWHLLTGEKKKIYELAKDGYLVNALQDDGSAEGFLHSELFVLIDKQKRIRGTYDGTDSVQVVKLIQDIKLLKKE